MEAVIDFLQLPQFLSCFEMTKLKLSVQSHFYPPSCSMTWPSRVQHTSVFFNFL